MVRVVLSFGVAPFPSSGFFLGRLLMQIDWFLLICCIVLYCIIYGRGGVCGLPELLILERTMQRVKVVQGLEEVPLSCEYFDIIGGANTGE